jgi:predicted RNA-binding Zn ribbon-like protein
MSAVELGLALANSLRAQADGSEADSLRTAGDLGAWLARHPDGTGGVGEEVALRVGEFRDLRGAIRELLGAAVRREPLPPDAVARVNEASARVAHVVRLDVSGPSVPVAVEEQLSGSDAARALGAVARSAIELLGGPEREWVRVCSARGCGRFFVARRPDRAWCSTACGTRERVARHYARRKSGLSS